MRKISSFALAFAFVVPMIGCPGDDTGTTDTAVDSGNVMTTTMGTMGTETPATDTSTTDPSETGPGDTTMGGGGDGGFCAQTCETAADCGAPEADWECNDSYCDYVGVFPECDPAMCDDLEIGVCGSINGVSQCTFPCPGGQADCDAFMLECNTVDDDGNDVCGGPTPEPCGGASEGEACDFGAGQSGVCQADGTCTCADDSECGIEGQGCRSDA